MTGFVGIVLVSHSAELAAGLRELLSQVGGASLTVETAAKRFNVEMQHLKRWNPRMGKALKPGQMLTVYSPH